MKLFAIIAALLFSTAQAAPITDLNQYASSGTGEWSVLGKATKTNESTLNDLFQFTFDGENFGTWTVTNISGNDLTLDLAMTLHAGSQKTSYLVDDLFLSVGESFVSPWSILPGRNGKFPDLNQLTVYERDIQVSQVPEPGSLAMMGLGLGLIALRRKQS